MSPESQQSSEIISSTFGPSAPPLEQELTTPLPRGESSLKVAVIGAGVFGSWASFFLQNKGYSVQLFDSWGPGNSRSSSGGDSRLFRGIYGKGHLYTGLAMRSVRWWKELENRSNAPLIHETGSIWMAYEKEVDFIHDSLPYLESKRLPYKKYEREETSSKFPFLNTSDLDHVIHEYKSGFIYAREACKQVVEEFRNMGGEFIIDTVTPGSFKNGKMTSAKGVNSGKIEADIFIFCGGPWLPKLFPFLAEKILTINRQEIYYFGCPEGFSHEKRTTLLPWVDWGKELHYGIPVSDRRGFKIANDTTGPEIDPDNMERVPSLEKVEKAREFMGHRFPFMKDAPLLESRICQYSNTPDGNYLMDKHPDASNLWIGGGGNGHGFKNGPEFGRLMVKSVLQDQALVDIFKFDRF